MTNDIGVMDLANVSSPMEVTESQKAAIVWFLEKNVEVLTDISYDFHRTMIGMAGLKLLLRSYGQDYTIQQWCQYWISWHKSVVEKYVAQNMSCAGFFSLDVRALEIIFKVNSILKGPLDIETFKLSSLSKFAIHLESYVEPEDPQDNYEDFEAHPSIVVSKYTGELSLYTRVTNDN